MKKYKCSRNTCQKLFKREDVVIHSRNKSGNIVWYYCLKCNREVVQRYAKTTKGRKRINQAVYKSVEKYKHKQDARQKLFYAVKKGRVIKPKQCKCGNKKVEGHHTDYSKPLEVQWMCRNCHRLLHRKELSSNQ